jgi:hypothetical protein
MQLQLRLDLNALISEHVYDNTAFTGSSPAHLRDDVGHNGGGGGGGQQQQHEMQERRVDSEVDLARMGYSVYNGKRENR